MIEPRRTSGGVMRAGHYVVVAAVAVVAALVAFAVLSFLVGVIVEIVKVALVAAVVIGAFWFLARHARRH